ncbi:pectate lyase [Alienimonas californiensis]|uniref:Pectic acid lyase n=1 Tax=Alienimonas californiensis TaxID=2527989 RepID=A0A517PEH9_9PLAN|nr:pectate lyase [Alienimonas californiensis]QDT17777.1 Pectic acid lyase [Alienimonas californiensis]
MPARRLALLLLAALGSPSPSSAFVDEPSRSETIAALSRAGRFYADEIAVRGGYVYFTELDGGRRWGEGEATPTQIWVQPPATPTVGEAFLAAHEATGDPAHLAAATAAGEALTYGQLQSGGWTNKIDFDPNGDPGAYRRGRGRGKNNSSLDDGQTPAALRLLMRLDAAHAGGHAGIAEAARSGLDALLTAQLSGGGFPQVWDGPTTDGPPLRASSPGDWRELPRIKAYWDLPTLNDGLAGQVVATLLSARQLYETRDPALAERADAAARRFGDFLIRAQLPAPQPGWAQQYDESMRPAWARVFEPPAVAASESQDVIEALLALHAATDEVRFLDPIHAALDYLERSALPDGRLPRYLELGTNRPLYMERRGREYRPTYDDADLPSHYGWKGESQVDALRERLAEARAGREPSRPSSSNRAAAARAAIDALDADGRWVEVSDGGPLLGQAKIPAGRRYVASATFAEHMTALAASLRADAAPE